MLSSYQPVSMAGLNPLMHNVPKCWGFWSVSDYFWTLCIKNLTLNIFHYKKVQFTDILLKPLLFLDIWRSLLLH